MSDRDPVTWHRLILHPADPSAEPTPQALRAALTSVGLIGAPIQSRGREYFLPGGNFLELVVFLGCSPVIELRPQYDADGEPQLQRFCHIHIAATRPAPSLHVGDPVAPRCPRCRARIDAWRELLPRWQAQPLAALWRCPACGEPASAAQIDWRQAAAVSRSRIELGGVHPYEAVPAERLLATLEHATGGAWKHYYARPHDAPGC